jgi:hypothetical protein
MAMRYEEVNQLAVSKASKSAAIDDWFVVRMEIFVATIAIRTSFEKVPREYNTKWLLLVCHGA